MGRVEQYARSGPWWPWMTVGGALGLGLAILIVVQNPQASDDPLPLLMLFAAFSGAWAGAAAKMAIRFIAWMDSWMCPCGATIRSHGSYCHQCGRRAPYR